MNVLFIGNSYTYFNDMPKLFENIAASNGKNVNVFSITKGGRKLYEYVRKYDEYTQQIDELIRNNRFDICFIQEQSQLPIKNYDLFAEGVKELTEKLKTAVDKFVLYATWGRKDGSKDLIENGWSNKEMTFDLAQAYKKASKIPNAMVSYVGLNFYDVYTNHKEINLYSDDLTHPSYKGSCLAVLTHYKTVFGEFPENTDALFLTKEEIIIFKNTVLKNLTV